MCLTDLAGQVDFALACYMVHELPAGNRFFAEVAEALKPGGCVLLAEPAGHVKPPMFETELQAAAQAGLEPSGRPAMGRSRAALLRQRG
ncbi:class I SAM-dependent methyltransferase [Candidatus Cryosericum hinesii]|uniref:class I SAM-dependent methyltransferase n=1 Tax=Candidatus Cryosericum hinesii TaxID=2290915 RepID=UPI001A9D81A3|nr:class I SAM-dependent methyltransferase [Candidatus Cryosericum hinesii]